MGARTFVNTVHGETASKAFIALVAYDREVNGHCDGYSGSVGSKSSYVLIPRDPALEPHKQAKALLNDPRVSNKWGPAGCFEVEPGVYCFFGWAPE